MQVKYEQLLFIVIIIISCVNTWNFSQVNLSSDVAIWRFVFWKNRVFLAIPRWQSTRNSTVTLLEAPWIEPEILFLMNIPQPPVRAFPNTKIQSANGDCDNIISVTGLDIDSRGRLWILDSPTTVDCPAKIIIYDVNRKQQINKVTLNGIITKDLKTLVIDPADRSAIHQRCFVGDPGDESIIVYNLGRTGQRKWWKLKLLRATSNVPRIYTNDLAVSRKNSRLYMTGGKSLNLFSINLDKLDSHEFNLFPRKINRGMRNITVKSHGIKLGVSSGLLSDYRDGLHYFLVSEYASVRWNTKNDLKATSHAVLLQNEQVLSITDYRMDSMKNVWGLVNVRYPFYDQQNTINTGKLHLPTSRIIQIMHYNNTLLNYNYNN